MKYLSGDQSSPCSLHVILPEGIEILLPKCRGLLHVYINACGNYCPYVANFYVSPCYIWWLQVTGGELIFNSACNEPSGEDYLYLVVGQSYKVERLYNYMYTAKKFNGYIIK